MDNEPILKVHDNGTKEWYLDGNHHRVDGPAIEYTDGTKFWYFNGKSHRVDGPAVETSNYGGRLWWLNGKSYFFDDWLEANKHISEEEKVMLKLQYG